MREPRAPLKILPGKTTIDYLRELRHGQVFNFYRGNFETDISSCGKDAPLTAQFLARIKETAEDLSKRGKIVLSYALVSSAQRGGTQGMANVYQYTATGA